MARVVKRNAAKRDLDEIAELLQVASPQLAIRFLEAADRAFERLASMPNLGSACDARKPALAGLRFWSIRGFPKYLIFYRPLADGIEVTRVLHGRRDIERLFEQ